VATDSKPMAPPLQPGNQLIFIVKFMSCFFLALSPLMWLLALRLPDIDGHRLVVIDITCVAVLMVVYVFKLITKFREVKDA
jgi:hypothetical protein